MKRPKPKTVFAILIAIASILAIITATGCTTNPSTTPIPVVYDIQGNHPQ